MAQPGIRIDGLDEIRRDLKAAGRKTSDLSKPHKEIAKKVEPDARRDAGGGTAQQRAAALSMLGSGDPKGSHIRLRNTNRVPFGIGAFMGSKAHPQFPKWVGNNYDLSKGEGPYRLAKTIERSIPEIEEIYLDFITAALDAAGLET